MKTCSEVGLRFITSWVHSQIADTFGPNLDDFLSPKALPSIV